MRKPERLDPFYAELKEIHKHSFPDLRFGQFMLNALGWIQSVKGIDPFFPEEDKMLNLIKEYHKNVFQTTLNILLFILKHAYEII